MVSFHFISGKDFQLDRIIYHNFSEFRFSGKVYDLLWDKEWREKNIFLKKKLFLSFLNLSNELKIKEKFCIFLWA